MVRINSYRDIAKKFKYPFYISKYFIAFSVKDADFGIFAGTLETNKNGCYLVKTGETSFYGRNHNIKHILKSKREYIEVFE